jgi:shikimate dehydrogenase
MIQPVQKDLYAVIGNPVTHSLSPIMMNAVFAALSIPAVYLALQVDNLADDLATLAKLGIQGLSVTIPHKELAFRLAVETDVPAQAMGAVNTLRLSGSRWEGRNTDWIGALSALRHALEQSAPHRHTETPPLQDEGTHREANTPSIGALHNTHHGLQPENPKSEIRNPKSSTSFLTPHSFQGQRVLLIGAGGVARAVGYGLKREGAAITISNRGMERGEALARAFEGEFLPLSELQRQGATLAFDIIVQCTSVGLLDEAEFTLIPDSLFRPGVVAMDTVYRPLWTSFLSKAKAVGGVIVPGVEMLLHQGVAQLEWWFEELIRPEAVLPIMRTALMGILADEEDNQKASTRI